MNHVFHRYPKHDLPFAVGGEGPYLIDAQGRRYIDASGGAAVSCLGHGHPKVIAAIKDQVDRLAYAHTSFFTTEATERLADMLIEAAPKGIERVYYVSGGSEAVETALKLARQYFLEIGQPQRRYFVGRLQSYHGNTLGALAVGGNMWRRKQFEPILIEGHHISPCYAYRGRRDDESEAEYGLRVANELEAKILELGKDAVIGFIAEPVVGATMGSVPSVPGYFKRIREICDKYGVLLILDEVMCGMGRTGTLFACEQDGIAPDIVAIAKGLGAGYQPIGATLASRQVFEAIVNGSGFFQHGFTYVGHATACAAALAVQTAIREDNLLANVKARGAELDQGLNERFGNHPYVGDIRGRGLFQSIEMVADRASKKPFDPALKINARIKKAAMANGLCCYPMGGCIDGQYGDHVLLAPPYIIDSEVVGQIVERLARAVDSALKEAGVA
ncbi:aspartate aminotransferase family protein [Shumkonia mesophila]|uniref:aspartate aminotransferase family protein n=1 Tax=Shumkonia mesophila TaxID=2838854 RepID=UPI0029350ADF|nr:aspartate aminotransferase family protein [Shumkonia mesophila]